MSDATIDTAVLKRTQDTLGKYVKKPVLSEKLLRKPPFRFLHDLFNAVIRETGCFEGLYTPDELNFETINDRDAKMQFLQKMIDVINIATNESLTVKTSKIVAGHEPEKTNELLQLMGTVIEKKLDWKAAIETVNTGGALINPKSKAKEKVAKEKKITDKPSPKVDGTKKSESSKDKDKTKTKVKDVSKPKDYKDKSLKKPKATDSDKQEERKTKSKISNKESSKKPVPDKAKKTLVAHSKSEPDSKPHPKSKMDDSTKSKVEPISDSVEQVLFQIDTKNNNQVEMETANVSLWEEFKKGEYVVSKRAEEILLTAATEDANDTDSRRSSGSKRSSPKTHRSSAEKARSLKAEDVNGKIISEPIESLKTVTEEPSPEPMVSPSLIKSQASQESVAKRESTFVRENSKESVQNPHRPRTSLRPPSARPASARPGAPRRRDKNIEIILQPNDQIKLSGISVKLETFNSELEDDGENLVIIENADSEDPIQESIPNNKRREQDESLQQGHLVQQILETQKELVQGGSPETDQNQNKDYDMIKLNSRQSSARQMNSLRDVIQTLTKSVNPLGKLMDFIPEDIDAMQLELTMWRDTYNHSSAELKKERNLTESVTEPMKNQLVTIESTIKEYREMIDGCRAKIVQNAEKIQRLLTTQ